MTTQLADHRMYRIVVQMMLVVAMVAMAGIASRAMAQGPQSVAELAERLSPAVVNISTRQSVKPGKDAVPMPQLPPGSPFKEFFDEFFKQQNPDGRPQPRSRQTSSLGSGFVVDPTGIIVTNNHVIEGADEIEVNFTDGSKLNAEIIGRDAKTDLAVLQVKPEKPLTAVNFGDSSQVRVGDWVLAIGNPFGLGGSVTLGILSARNRNINAGPYDDFLQTDAAINRGNSGGPLFDMDGNVIGINTAIISPTGGSIGIGFAIPSKVARTVIDQLRQFGETRRGWLGVKIQSVTDDIAESLGLDKARGALVADVTPTGPAEKSGIKAGDVIVRFDGKLVDEMRDLPRIVAETPVGKAVSVDVIRKGKPETISVTIGRLEEGEKIANAATGGSAGKAATAEILGMTLAPIDDDLRAKYKISENITGAVVTEVAPDGPAAEKRIEPGDVIAEAGETEINGPGDVAARVEELRGEGRNSILLLVLKAQRNFDPHFIALRIKE